MCKCWLCLGACVCVCVCVRACVRALGVVREWIGRRENMCSWNSLNLYITDTLLQRYEHAGMHTSKHTYLYMSLCVCEILVWATSCLKLLKVCQPENTLILWQTVGIKIRVSISIPWLFFLNLWYKLMMLLCQ